MNIFGVKRTVKMTGFARPSKARLQAGKIMPFIFFLAVSFVSSSYGQNDTSATTQHQDVSPFLEPSPTVSAKNIQDSHLQTSTVPMATPASSQSNSSDHQAASSSTSIKPEDATTVVPVQSTPIELQGSSLPITTDGALSTSPTAEVNRHSLIPKSSESFVSASSASPSPGDTETIIVLATGDVEETTVWEEGISVSEEPSEIPTTSVVSELTSSPSTTVSTETASVTIATVTNETITTTMHGQVTTSPSAEVTTPNIVTITTSDVEVTTVSDTTESLTTVVTSSTVSASTAVTTEALTTADTTTVTELTSTSLPPTTPPWPTLNTSDAFANHWVISVFQVSLDVDVSSLSFVAKMERSLAELYSIAFHRQEVAASKAQRRRRAVTYGNTTAQVINITRSASEPLHTSVVYYLQRLGNITVAAEVAAIMHTLNEQEIAIITELVVISKAEVYVPPPPPPDSYLWIIGAAIGGLIGLIFVIWCLLFIYFKCTRPTHPKTARSPRSVRSIDPEGSFRTKKDIRGFDIVRTEVGLESEIHREKTRSMIEPYRNRDGSTDLEGMYSAGESPPSHLPGKGASLRSQTHSQIGSGGRQLPRGPGNQQKRISKHTSEESEDDPESAATTDSERRPLSKSSRGKKVAPKVKDKSKSKGQPIREESESEEEESGEDEDHDSQAGIYENAGRIAKTNTPQLRTTPHAIRLPPLSQHPLVANHPPSDKEIYESLRDKAEAEKQRNKQRQRDKKKGGKKSKKDKEEIKDPKAKKAYKKVQKEIGAVLGEPVVPKQLPDVFVAQPKKSKKKKAPKRSNSLDPAETSPDSMEMRDLPQAKHPVMQVNGLGHLESDDSENDSNLDENGDPQAFEEARQRMHALLDDAFALIAPHRNDTQTTSDQPETNNEPQHSPMYVNGGKKADAVDHRFNPYNAADEVAKIKDPYPPGVIDTTPETARRTKSPTQKVAAPTTGVVYPRPVSGQDYQYANPAFAGSGKSSPVVLGTKVLPNSHLNPNSVGQKTAQELRQDMQPEDYTSIAMDARMFAPNSNILARSHSPPERDSSETVDMQSSNMPKAGPIISDPSRSHGYHQSGYPIQSDSQSDLLLEKAKLSTKNQSQQNKWANERVSKPFEEQKRKGNGDSNDKKKKKTGSLLEEGDDELDVVERVIQPGMNQEPLVRSIREELQRLARRGNNSDHIV